MEVFLMNKFFSLVLPYIVLIFVGIMTTIDIAQKLVIEGLVIGILSGLWFMCLQKVEGTTLMKTGMILSLVFYVIGAILSFTNVKIQLLYDLGPILAYLIAIECIGLIIVCQNKPHLSMTYRYSYKNKKRRYF